MVAENLRKNVTRQLIKRLAEHEHGFKRKTTRLLLCFAVLYLVYLFCSGDYGLFRIHRLKAQKESLEKKYLNTLAEAADYKYRLRRINDDPHYVEWLARTRYGFSRPGETIYHLQVNR
ncbi:MAG: septum formation initiator family protein [Candidatus Zixiibacteriota bacterium]